MAKPHAKLIFICHDCPSRQNGACAIDHLEPWKHAATGQCPGGHFDGVPLDFDPEIEKRKLACGCCDPPPIPT